MMESGRTSRWGGAGGQGSSDPDSVADHLVTVPTSGNGAPHSISLMGNLEGLKFELCLAHDRG